jgi:hypothetical protein
MKSTPSPRSVFTSTPRIAAAFWAVSSRRSAVEPASSPGALRDSMSFFIRAADFDRHRTATVQSLRRCRFANHTAQLTPENGQMRVVTATSTQSPLSANGSRYFHALPEGVLRSRATTDNQGEPRATSCSSADRRTRQEDPEPRNLHPGRSCKGTREYWRERQFHARARRLARSPTNRPFATGVPACSARS